MWQHWWPPASCWRRQGIVRHQPVMPVPAWTLTALFCAPSVRLLLIVAVAPPVVSRSPTRYHAGKGEDQLTKVRTRGSFLAMPWRTCSQCWVRWNLDDPICSNENEMIGLGGKRGHCGAGD